MKSFQPSELSQFLKNFLLVAREHFATTNAEPRNESRIHLLKTPSELIRQSCSEVENGEEFRTLVKELDRLSGRRDAPLQWVRHFFRRHGIYSRLIAGEEVDCRECGEALHHAIFTQQTTVRWFAPIDCVEFDQEDMQFPGFSITRFSRKDLEALLNGESVRAFYPESVVDVDLLSDYWFVCASENITRPAPCKRPSSKKVFEGLFDPRPIGGFRFSSHPPAIEKAFRILALFDWDSALPVVGNTPYTLSLPIAIGRTDSIVAHPGRAPSLDELSFEPLVSDEGVQCGLTRFTELLLEGDHLVDFRTVVEQAQRALQDIEREDSEQSWRFLAVGMGFLLKALTTRRHESFLANVTSIEAMLGEKGDKVTERLAQRVARIRGGTKTNRDKSQERFKKLYNLRCELVHGSDKLASELLDTNLKELRSEARTVAAYMLDVCARKCNEKRVGDQLMSRKQLLASIFGKEPVTSETCNRSQSGHQ